MTDELADYLTRFLQTDQGDLRELAAMCSNYVYASGVNCCTGFDLDPRFAEMNRAQMRAQVGKRTTEMAEELGWLASRCAAAGKAEKARMACTVALDFLREDDAIDSDDYRRLEAQLAALG